MPKRAEITPQQFADFDRIMREEYGFKRIDPAKIAADRERLGLVFPKRRREPGSEVGYYVQIRELTLMVWTTWFLEKGAPREHDQGWVLIARGDLVLHFEYPFNRTKNFLQRLRRYARINQVRLLTRRQCEHCKRHMQIVERDELKQRDWGCQHINDHPGQEQILYSFNEGLPPKMFKYQDRDARRRRRYHEKREEAGLPNFVAMLGRKRAKITKPENIEW